MSSDKDAAQRGVPVIDEQRLWRHAEAFAHSTRLSGSPEELAAFKYAQAELDGLGFTTKFMLHDGYVSWPGPASLELGGTDYPCITHAMGAHRPDGVTAVVADLTDVAPSEWSAAQVTGRMAIVLGLASPSLVKHLIGLGATAAVFVSGEHTHEMIVSAVWGSPDPVTVGLLPDLPVVSINSGTLDRLRHDLSKHSDPELTMKTSVDTRWRELPLLEARLDSENGDGDFVLFSGHIDVWHLGAMDNGAANATMLEVAAQIASQREKLRRGLRLAFWSGHSHGRYAGSSWYADQNFEEIRDHCVLHVNIDSVGGKGADDLAYAAVMSEVKALGSRAVATVTSVPFQGVRSERAGDQSFYGHGVSSLFMGLSEQPAPASTEPVASESHAMFGRGRLGFGWWWHTTEDTIDKLDPARLARDARVYLAAVMEACCSEVLPLRFGATVVEIQEAVRGYLEPVEHLVDASRTFDRLQRLEAAIDGLEALIDGEWIAPAVANRVLKALGRSLVPINYVHGSIFEHDLALKQGPVPSLEIARTADGLDAEGQKRLAVALRRRLNRIESSLRDALDAVEPALVAREP